MIKHPVLLCTLTVSLGLLAAGSLRAQTAAPAAPATPAASLASDPATAAASPTPVGAGTTTAAPEKKLREHQPTAKALAKYDTNKNGVLDPEERAAMKKDRAARREERMKKYDKNGDGKLDADEKATAKADKKAEKGQ